MGNADYIDVVENAVREYSKTAKSHACGQSRKEKMLQKVTQIEALIRGSNRGQSAIFEQKIKPKINQLLEDLILLSPVTARPGFTKISNTGNVLKRQNYNLLVQEEGLYWLKGPQADSTKKLADGSYVFTVLASAPWEVRIGRRANGGHTAISRGADVYFAGEITFNNGRIVEWNNSSGHYLPDARFRAQAGSILPIAKFNHFR